MMAAGLFTLRPPVAQDGRGCIQMTIGEPTNNFTRDPREQNWLSEPALSLLPNKIHAFV